MAVLPDSLPTPAERPGAALVIFDGRCTFCTRNVRRLHRWDQNHRLAFLSLHDPLIGQRFSELSGPQLISQMHVATNDGKTVGGADAIRYLARLIPRLYWLVPLMHVPLTMPLWRWLYRIVARHRYWISAGFGRECLSGTCRLHQR